MTRRRVGASYRFITARIALLGSGAGIAPPAP